MKWLAQNWRLIAALAVVAVTAGVVILLRASSASADARARFLRDDGGPT